MGSGFWIFTSILAIIVLIIVCLVGHFFGVISKELLSWALSSLNFSQIATNASATNKAVFNKFKEKISNFLKRISLFGAPPKSTATTKAQSYGEFLKYIGLKVIAVLIQTFLGVYALWMCKVAQTNILPSDFRGAPYTDLPPIIDSIITQVNFFKLDGDDYSTKLLFQYLYIPDKSANDSKQINSQFTILNTLREINESPTISGTTMYFIYLLENIFCLNFSMINMFFSFFNSFYEWVLVLFGSYLLIFVFVVNILLSNIVFLYIFFAGIFTWIWKLNKPQVVVQDGQKLTKPNFVQNWVYITLFSMPFTWLFTLIETIFLLNCFLPFLVFGNMAVFPLITLYCILSICFIVAKVTEGSKTGETYTFMSLYVNKMRYMITPIFIIMSIYIIIAAKAYLGSTERNAAIVAVVIVLIALMNIPITNVSDFGTKDTELYNYMQAEKRTQFKLSSTVLWALSGAVTSGDLAINIANQINKIQKFDNHVNQVQGNTVPQQQQQQQQQQQLPPQVQTGGKNLFTDVEQSDNLIKKMQLLNNKIRENITMSVMPM
jgi:hypothetical protein